MGQAFFWLSVTVCRPSYKKNRQTIEKLFIRKDHLGVVPLRALLDLRPWRPRSDRKMGQSTPLESRTTPVHVLEESQNPATLSQEEFLDQQHRDSSEDAEEDS
jgi:hypothetical protein